jgi:hypothetical protein
MKYLFLGIFLSFAYGIWAQEQPLTLEQVQRLYAPQSEKDILELLHKRGHLIEDTSENRYALQKVGYSSPFIRELFLIGTLAKPPLPEPAFQNLSKTPSSKSPSLVSSDKPKQEKIYAESPTKERDPLLITPSLNSPAWNIRQLLIRYLKAIRSDFYQQTAILEQETPAHQICRYCRHCPAIFIPLIPEYHRQNPCTCCGHSLKKHSKIKTEYWSYSPKLLSPTTPSLLPLKI